MNNEEKILGILETMSADISELKTDMSGVKTDVSGLKTDMSGVKARLDNVETTMSGVNDRLDNVELTISGMSKNVENVRRALVLLEDDHKTITGALSDGFKNIERELKRHVNDRMRHVG
jgi:predicted  nucleic acid-binding Zn-ribbon protein